MNLYATLVDGEPFTQTWSIGPPPSPVLGLPALGKAGLGGLAVSNATLPICRTPKRFSWYFC